MPDPITSTAETAAAIAARGPCRASQRSTSSVEASATVSRSSARAGRRSACAQGPASTVRRARLGVDLVAPGDARQAVAREEQEVERGRGDADERLHAAHADALGWGEDRHG